MHIIPTNLEYIVETKKIYPRKVKKFDIQKSPSTDSNSICILHFPCKKKLLEGWDCFSADDKHKIWFNVPSNIC